MIFKDNMKSGKNISKTKNHPVILGNAKLKRLSGQRSLVSWSGGKDSCLALHRAIKAGAHVEVMVNMLLENGRRSHSHGLRTAVIQEQARALGLCLEGVATSWDEYEKDFCEILLRLKHEGFEAAIFGDIDLQAHLDWERMVCNRTGLIPALPLWRGDRMALIQEFIETGFEARIVAVKADCLAPEYLGRVLSMELAHQFEKQGLDVCGENGEFHTVVTNGPCFQYPLEITFQHRVLKDGYWFLDLKSKL
jgi:uncharacterized protein (TIGR00290 family)